MFKLNNWKQTIYKDDIKAVILKGFLIAILGGILAGLVDYLLVVKLDSQFTIGLIIIAYFIVYKLKGAYFNYHILYPVLGVVFFIIGMYVSHITEIFITFKDYDLYLEYILKDPEWHFAFITRYYTDLKCAFEYKDVLDIFWSIFNILVLVLLMGFCYKGVKGRN